MFYSINKFYNSLKTQEYPVIVAKKGEVGNYLYIKINVG